METRLVDVRIDRTSPVPLWHQLSEQLTAAVHDGLLQPGDPFENELAIAARLNLSRPTVRRAMQEMVDQGLLVRRRGIGTTVANRKVHRRAALSSLHDDLLRAGQAPTTTVLELGPVRDPRAAAALDLPADAELLAVVRLRSADGSPLAVMRNWLPPTFADITLEELSGDGLYAALRARGANPVVARQSVGARMPTPAERRRLAIVGQQPVLTMTRTAFGGDGAAIEFGDHCYRAEDYSLDLLLDER
ncbi:GntR family transcriptional regulator [Oryzobacter terrae]|uniref:GntR family transcriptional regulator n=1 Tax=Oryzobacter terrae TaxID=1620385 RepID=UPI00366E2C13